MNLFNVRDARILFSSMNLKTIWAKKNNYPSRKDRRCRSSNSIRTLSHALVVILWSWKLVKSLKDKKTKRDNWFHRKQHNTWPRIVYDATDAKRISAHLAMLIHIMLERLVTKITTKHVDFAVKNSSSLLQVWNQLLEMFVEKENASTWCKSHAIKSWHVVMSVVVQQVRSNACRAWKVSASQRWIKT